MQQDAGRQGNQHPGTDCPRTVRANDSVLNQDFASITSSQKQREQQLPTTEILTAALAAATAAASQGSLAGGNPRVGCVLLQGSGTAAHSVAVGYHHGAGTAHAEVAALRELQRKRAADPQLAQQTGPLTAIVTLEPCNHHGKTGPCSHALLSANVDNVIYAQPDPNPQAAGGGQYLREHGVQVLTAAQAGIPADTIAQARGLVAEWLIAVRRERPWTIAKVAQTLDGYVAAVDGTSQWITGKEARAYGHEIRHQVDAILVGSGTVIADNPALTARADAAAPQPLPVVIGKRALPPQSQLARNPRTLHLPTHDLEAAMRELYQRGCKRVLIEGGPTLVTAALRAGIVDELHMYQAPMLLGAGKRGIGDLGVKTLSEAWRGEVSARRQLGADELTVLRFTAAPTTPAAETRTTCLPD